MSTQLNLRFNDDLLKKAKEYAKLSGFLNVQEFIRETLREKLYNEHEIKEEYMKRLESKDATTFLLDEEAELVDKELEKRAKL